MAASVTENFKNKYKSTLTVKVLVFVKCTHKQHRHHYYGQVLRVLYNCTLCISLQLPVEGFHLHHRDRKYVNNALAYNLVTAVV